MQLKLRQPEYYLSHYRLINHVCFIEKEHGKKLVKNGKDCLQCYDAQQQNGRTGFREPLNLPAVRLLTVRLLTIRVKSSLRE